MASIYGLDSFESVSRAISGHGGVVGRTGRKLWGALAPKGNRRGPAIVDAATTATTGVSRAIVAQYTRLGALRQTTGGPLRPRDGAAAVASGARQLHQPRALRRPGEPARTHARWFARPFPFARLAVSALGAVHPRSMWELLVLERHGPRRPLGAGSLPAGRGGR